MAQIRGHPFVKLMPLKLCHIIELKWMPSSMNYLDIQLYPNLDEIPLEPLLQKIKLNLDKNGKMVADSQFNNDVCIKPQLFK